MKKQLILVAALAAVCASASARAAFFDVRQLSHRVGEYSAGWWRAAVVKDLAGIHTTYGPNVTNLPTGDALAVTTFGAFPGPTQNVTLKWNVEVFDGAHNLSLNSVSYARPWAPDGTGFHYVTMLPFSSDPTQNIQMRTRSFGNGTLDQCGVHIMNERDNKITDVSPVTDQYHQVGHAYRYPWLENEDHWEASCNTSGCNQMGYLTYGPYWNLFNDHTATVFALFDIAINADDFGAGPIAELSVTAYDGGQLVSLASRDLNASDFPQRWARTKFPLKFDVLPSRYSYEYRVFWYGKGTVWQQRTKILDPKDGHCTW